MRKHKGVAVIEEKPVVVVEPAYAVIDYPQEKEIVTSTAYTLRVGAGAEAVGVDVSIDDGVWQPCRQAVGYWWFDWSDYPKGKHVAVARVNMKDGRSAESPKRAFTVRLPSAGTAKKAPRVSKTKKKLAKLLGDAGLHLN